MDLPLPKPNIDLSGNQNTFPSLPSDGSSDNKRKIMLFAGIFGVLAIGALIAGIILSPTHSPKDLITQKAKNKTTNNTGKPFSLPNTSSTNTSVNTEATPEDNSEQLYGTPTPTIDPLFEETGYTPTPTPTLTPTPLPGPFYIANGKQNDLIWKFTWHDDADVFDELHLINTKTHEDRLLGRALDTTPGDNVFFSKDFSQLIFIGGKVGQADYEQINFYSIPKNAIVRQITLNDIKAQLPTLTIQDLSILCRMFLSPSGNKIALSYGRTWYTGDPIDPNSAMIILDLQTNKMTMLKTRGIVSSWKDDNTILYEISNPAIPDNTDPNNNIISETSINDIQTQ